MCSHIKTSLHPVHTVDVFTHRNELTPNTHCRIAMYDCDKSEVLNGRKFSLRRILLVFGFSQK